MQVKKFENPEIEIVKIDVVDVITDSWTGEEGDNTTGWH